jgi:hypothetical protein
MPLIREEAAATREPASAPLASALTSVTSLAARPMAPRSSVARAATVAAPENWGPRAAREAVGRVAGEDIVGGARATPRSAADTPPAMAHAAAAGPFRAALFPSRAAPCIPPHTSGPNATGAPGSARKDTEKTGGAGSGAPLPPPASKPTHAALGATPRGVTISDRAVDHAPLALHAVEIVAKESAAADPPPPVARRSHPSASGASRVGGRGSALARSAAPASAAPAAAPATTA